MALTSVGISSRGPFPSGRIFDGDAERLTASGVFVPGVHRFLELCANVERDLIKRMNDLSLAGHVHELETVL